MCRIQKVGPTCHATAHKNLGGNLFQSIALESQEQRVEELSVETGSDEEEKDHSLHANYDEWDHLGVGIFLGGARKQKHWSVPKEGAAAKPSDCAAQLNAVHLKIRERFGLAQAAEKFVSKEKMPRNIKEFLKQMQNMARAVEDHHVAKNQTQWSQARQTFADLFTTDLTNE